jgi:type IV secretory pathway VirJ component
VLAVIAGGGYWYLKRPAPQPTLQPLTAADGTVMTRVIPGTQPKAQVLVAVNDDQKLTDNQLSTLSRSASAQIVQVILPKDCLQQSRALQTGLRELNGPATLVSGIGPGAVLAWRWLSEQKDDKAQAISVDLAWKNRLHPPAEIRRPRPLAGGVERQPGRHQRRFRARSTERRNQHQRLRHQPAASAEQRTAQDPRRRRQGQRWPGDPGG